MQETQLSLAKKYHLPLFLHSRAAHSDFVQILKEEGFGTHGGANVGGKGGVVHSFTGSTGEAQELVGTWLRISHEIIMTRISSWTWAFIFLSTVAHLKPRIT